MFELKTRLNAKALVSSTGTGDKWPCKGRTYGPLIKSELQGMTQVVECLGHPLLIAGDRRSCLLALSVSF